MYVNDRQCDASFSAGYHYGQYVSFWLTIFKWGCFFSIIVQIFQKCKILTIVVYILVTDTSTIVHSQRLQLVKGNRTKPIWQFYDDQITTFVYFQIAKCTLHADG